MCKCNVFLQIILKSIFIFFNWYEFVIFSSLFAMVLPHFFIFLFNVFLTKNIKFSRLCRNLSLSVQNVSADFSTFAKSFGYNGFSNVPAMPTM